MTGERLTYRFGPLERRGLFGQVRGGQAAAVATGAAAAIVVLDRAPSAVRRLPRDAARRRRAARRVRAARPPHRRGVGAGGARVLAPARARADAVPLARRRPAGWWRPSARRRCAGCSAIRSRTLRPRSRASGPRRPVSRPAGRGALRARGRRLTAVLACRVLAFSLLDAEAQERRLARWGLILSGAAAGPVRRIQWIERTAPAQGDELARWLHDERDPAVPLRGTPMIESYLELIGSTTRATQEHEVLLAIQVDARRVADRGATAGTRAGRADRAGRAGARGRRGHGARRAQPRAARAHAENGVRPVRPRRAGRRSRRPSRTATASTRPTPGRWARASTGSTTRPTARSTRPTGSAAGRGSTSRRCSWTRCWAAPAWCARSR